jgi:hypothetical protein
MTRKAPLSLRGASDPPDIAIWATPFPLSIPSATQQAGRPGAPKLHPEVRAGCNPVWSPRVSLGELKKVPLARGIRGVEPTIGQSDVVAPCPKSEKRQVREEPSCQESEGVPRRTKGKSPWPGGFRGSKHLANQSISIVTWACFSARA